VSLSSASVSEFVGARGRVDDAFVFDEVYFEGAARLERLSPPPIKCVPSVDCLLWPPTWACDAAAFVFSCGFSSTSQLGWSIVDILSRKVNAMLKPDWCMTLNSEFNLRIGF
jgi:hypothetical protein